jgi:hypothetical protein
LVVVDPRTAASDPPAGPAGGRRPRVTPHIGHEQRPA